jgi:hypothetical protein
VSSAILYVAIVAIWACVLIPRWLRRDSAHGASSAASETIPVDMAPGDDVADDIDSGTPAPAPAPADEVQAGAVPVRGGAVPVQARARPEADERRDDAAEPPADDAPPPLTPEESRRRMLAARRRLLGMMLALEAAAIALAVLGLAALWVVIPPSIMLSGYLLLLREVAHADAERAEREREAVRAGDRARERARTRARASQRPAGTVAAPASPVPGYEDAGPGRDFAPGLAGKYTTSNAEVIAISERADDDYGDDEYTGNKLRAVGD